MTLKIIGAAAAVIAIAAPFAAHAGAPAAAAPAAATAPATFTPPPGAPITGICIFSLDKAIGDSTVGKVFQTRLQQLAAQVEAELNPERTAIQTEGTALQAQQRTITPEQFQTRATAINQRIEAYGAKEQLRARELDETRNRALQEIITAMNPALVTAYTQRNCAVVLDQQGVITSNTAMDISPAVTAQLNATKTTITFDRVRLDTAAAPAPAAR